MAALEIVCGCADMTGSVAGRADVAGVRVAVAAGAGPVGVSSLCEWYEASSTVIDGGSVAGWEAGYGRKVVFVAACMWP